VTLSNVTSDPRDRLRGPVPPLPRLVFPCPHGHELGHGCAVCDPKGGAS
jgi:hypothetical protein